MRKLICTTYNKLADGTLQLRNNWIEEIITDEQLNQFLNKWNVGLHLHKLQKVNTVSDILEGRSGDLDNVLIHCRLIKF